MNCKFKITLFFIGATLICKAQVGNAILPKAAAYINAYKNIAMAEMQRTGVPASITLAQGLLESGYGESELCKKSNNHFGIKCKTEWTGEKTYHNDDESGECFRVYTSAEESYKDHSNFLRTRSHYNFLFNLPITDFEAWAFGLKKAGYATEKNYPQRLIKIINDYNLHEFTLMVTGNTFANNITDKSNIDTGEVIIQDTVLGELIIPLSKKKTATFAPSFEEEENKDSVVILHEANSDNNVIVTKANNYPTGIFTINHTKVIFATKNTSYLALANNYNIDLAKLFEYNDMDATNIVEESCIIFLERKQNKGATDFHVVQSNETLYSIAQQEGIRLQKLLEYNKLQKNSIVKQGDKLFLRNNVVSTISK
jgi:Mannosyl-glycoprotein endo-beta-N-acetylglucosaminidase/LysM domain